MNTNSAQPKVIGGVAPDALSSMFQSLGALHNFRAAVAAISCVVLGALLFAIVTVIGQGGFGAVLLGGLLFALFVLTGWNAAAVLLLDQARGVPRRRVADAIVYGLLCVPKDIVLGIELLLAAVGVFMLLAILFYASKIPGLGPILFTVTLPLAVVVSGVTISGLGLSMLMAAIAAADGATITRALAQSFGILRSRLVESLVLLSVVAVLTFIVGAIVFAILAFGLGPAVGLSTMIGVQAPSSVPSILGGGLGGGFSGNGGGHFAAGGFGLGVLWAAAFALVSLVGLLGAVLVYLRVTEGLDASATETAMAHGLEHVKRHAADMGQRAKEAADRAREHAHAAAAAAAAARAAPSTAELQVPMAAQTCPACNAAITPQDLFCGSCGHKLS